jgi:hypothetical protein
MSHRLRYFHSQANLSDQSFGGLLARRKTAEAALGQKRYAAEGKAKLAVRGLSRNVDGLLSVTMAESDERVDYPTMLILKHVGQVLKILHRLIAYSADRPVLSWDIHFFFARIFWVHYRQDFTASQLRELGCVIPCWRIPVARSCNTLPSSYRTWIWLGELAGSQNANDNLPPAIASYLPVPT